MELKTTRVPDCPPDLVSPGWKIELLEDGKSISRLWVVDRIMRIGGAQMKLGGISSVGTDDAFRRKGLAAQVMEAALKLMEREGHEAALLHGIPDFYHRFGYSPCMPEYGIRIATLNAERAPGPLAMRSFQESDIPAIARIYNGENAWRTGTAVRDAETWKGFPRSVGWWMKPAIRVTVDGRDRVTGYVVFDDDASQVPRRRGRRHGRGGARDPSCASWRNARWSCGRKRCIWPFRRITPWLCMRASSAARRISPIRATTGSWDASSGSRHSWKSWRKGWGGSRSFPCRRAAWPYLRSMGLAIWFIGMGRGRLGSR